METFELEARTVIEADRWAEEVAKESPRVAWVTYVPDRQYGVVISLPHECSVSGTLTYREDGTADLYVDIFHVHEALQRRGIGGRLMRALIKEGLEYGASTLSGHVTSKSALATRARVFGPKNLYFYTPGARLSARTTYEEAQKLEKVDFIVSSSLKPFMEK